MGLQEYKRKRNFKKTPEPAGKVATGAGSSFVIQKHAASRLHYDFRLEMEGVLRSWAVPKGPSLDPGEKRLAVHVEDHPLDYGDFEGVIPKGEYGGGTVLLWDRGTWHPDGDPVKGYRKGHLRFRLDGQKLRGEWDLVRMHGHQAGDREQNWILIKVADEEARPGSADAVVKDRPESVASGLGIEEIAADPDRSPGQVAGVKITHPDRVLYPEQGLTKGGLALFYERIADWILPHLKDRPLTLVRCPEGKLKQCFYQKHVTDQFPASIRRVEIEEGGGKVLYGAVDSVAGLVSLIQMGTLEIHIWGSHIDNVERPDYLVFDLDPDEGLGWDRVVEGALAVRTVLEELGLQAFLKTTGGKGLHVCVPLVRRAGWDDVKGFTRAVVEHIVSVAPSRFTSKLPKASRKGKVFIDYLRNGRGATSIATYSTRARPGAPVSTPLFWEELETDVRGNTFTVRNLPERLEGLESDPWASFLKVRQSITAAMRKAVGVKT
jgi:bifunctional non-homologous end joining protein LigD